ncbi:glycoside hydrolase family 16 protein [Aaosphaeria arxii CBS 175.79]|uniref:endo-1,3(4)-beta-glucanase n=1 Tax=Aaosphaeria arxii CBS 175.79 TaxID=1450172 RepID=A0A6A5Y9Y8_9PLEO|nr:glycoside hydrolase family 16 protein [Aaosphaeria arxii CBS 175.79]KAF2022149.1 glycoside hydrolase family 16 protein [Aaosphaeria arxii CBS 175.79]
MFLRVPVASLALLIIGVKGLPAGPGYFPSNVPVTNTTTVSAAAFGLIDTYDASNWLSKFDVQAIADPTHGYVNYVNQAQAQSLGLIKTQNNAVYMGVDHTSVLNPSGTGRNSVRLQSKTGYNSGLVIADFAHVPGSNCGSWPAFWMVGPNWPNQGELDILEGVNLNTYNQVTLHTSPGCVPSVGAGGESGRRIGNADCGANGGFVGCGVESASATSYGTAFNANGGGVYAALWTSSGIKVWYFAAKNVPANIRSGNPDPNTWGTPTANFAGCDFGGKFRDMHMVFDITFCGDWAGSVWGSSSCAQVNPSCNAYVASQPQSFADSYWLVNSVKVYSV